MILMRNMRFPMISCGSADFDVCFTSSPLIGQESGHHGEQGKYMFTSADLIISTDNHTRSRHHRRCFRDNPSWLLLPQDLPPVQPWLQQR